MKYLFKNFKMSLNLRSTLSAKLVSGSVAQRCCKEKPQDSS